MTNCAAVVAVVMATSFLLVTVWSKQVPFHVCAIFWNAEQRQVHKHLVFLQETENFQAYYYKSDNFQSQNIQAQSFQGYYYKSQNFQSQNFQACYYKSDNFQSQNIQAQNFQAYYYKSDGPILPAPWGILIMHWMWNTVCSSWVFSNAEAQWYFH